MRTPRLPLPFLLALCLAVVLGYLIGRIATSLAWQQTPLTIRDDVRPRVPVVTIDGNDNGALAGSVNGDARLMNGDTLVPLQDGRFRIPLSSLKAVHIVTVPAGMQFVASKNGKKYYPARSPAAETLSPRTRVYFRTAAEAEAAGFRP